MQYWLWKICTRAKQFLYFSRKLYWPIYSTIKSSTCTCRSFNKGLQFQVIFYLP